MRLAIACVALFAVAARSGCGDAGADPYDPCAGKPCGEACRACAPDDRNCAETAVVKACDPSGRCVPAAPGLCGEAAPCAGKACGAPCTVDPPCRAATPPCAMPSVAGTCSADGTCLPLGLPVPVPACPPAWDCAGRACGDPCGFCPADVDPARCPVPTFAPTACDAALQCVTQGTFTCPAAQAP